MQPRRWPSVWWPSAREAGEPGDPWPWRRQPIGAASAAPRAERPSAAATSTRIATSAAWVGVEQQTAATSSISVRSVSWPTAEITGTRSSATVRQSVSSQNAQRSARLPPPRATMITSTSGRAARSLTAPAIFGAAWRSWTGGWAKTARPAPERGGEARDQIRLGRRAAPGDDPDRARQGGLAQPLLCLEQALGGELLAQPASWASRSPSPASRSSAERKLKAGEAVALPG